MNAVWGEQRRKPATQGAATDRASKVPLQLEEGEASRVPKQDVLNPPQSVSVTRLGIGDFIRHDTISIWQVIY
jgi:hypothetical protein